MKKPLIIAAGLLLLALGGDALFLQLPGETRAAGTTYYVATTGNDANSCAQATNSATPKRIIQAGVNCATAAGDTVIVKAGTYVEAVASWPASGTAGNPITIKANPGDAVTWRSSDTSTSSHNGAITIFDRKYIRIQGFTFDGSVTDWTIRVVNTHLFDGNSTARVNFPVVGIEIIGNAFSNNGNNSKANNCTTGSAITIEFSGVGNECDPGGTTSKIESKTFSQNYGHDIELGATHDVLVEANLSTGLKGSQDINNSQGYMARSILIGAHGPYNGFLYEASRNVVQNNIISGITRQNYMDSPFTCGSASLEAVGIRLGVGGTNNIIRRNVVHDMGNVGWSFDNRGFGYFPEYQSSNNFFYTMWPIIHERPAFGSERPARVHLERLWGTRY